MQSSDEIRKIMCGKIVAASNFARVRTRIIASMRFSRRLPNHALCYVFVKITKVRNNLFLSVYSCIYKTDLINLILRERGKLHKTRGPQKFSSILLSVMKQ